MTASIDRMLDEGSAPRDRVLLVHPRVSASGEDDFRGSIIQMGMWGNFLLFKGCKAEVNEIAYVTCLDGSQASGWEQILSLGYAWKASQEIKNVEGAKRSWVHMWRRLSMRADHPTVDVDEGAKEFMSEESSTIGLLEINAIGGKDTS
jgi:hypothetical protein